MKRTITQKEIDRIIANKTDLLKSWQRDENEAHKCVADLQRQIAHLTEARKILFGEE